MNVISYHCTFSLTALERYFTAAIKNFGLSFKKPIPRLHELQSIPLTFPVAWQWSIQSLCVELHIWHSVMPISSLHTPYLWRSHCWRIISFLSSYHFRLYSRLRLFSETLSRDSCRHCLHVFLGAGRFFCHSKSISDFALLHLTQIWVST